MIPVVMVQAFSQTMWGGTKVIKGITCQSNTIKQVLH